MVKHRIPNAGDKWHEVYEANYDRLVGNGMGGRLPPSRPVCEQVKKYYPNTHGIPLEESALVGMACQCDNCQGTIPLPEEQ